MAWMEDFASTICPLVVDESRDVPVRKKRHVESNIQSSCVRWFRYQYPQYLLAAVPNGGRRDLRTGAIMKREGALAGMPDLLLLHPAGGYHGMAIEMKTDVGRQSEAQREIEKKMKDEGYLYVVVRSFDEFVGVIEKYISDK